MNTQGQTEYVIVKSGVQIRVLSSDPNFLTTMLNSLEKRSKDATDNTETVAKKKRDRKPEVSVQNVEQSSGQKKSKRQRVCFRAKKWTREEDEIILHSLLNKVHFETLLSQGAFKDRTKKSVEARQRMVSSYGVYGKKGMIPKKSYLQIKAFDQEHDNFLKGGKVSPSPVLQEISKLHKQRKNIPAKDLVENTDTTTRQPIEYQTTKGNVYNPPYFSHS
jgi:hypothetical protein